MFLAIPSGSIPANAMTCSFWMPNKGNNKQSDAKHVVNGDTTSKFCLMLVVIMGFTAFETLSK